MERVFKAWTKGSRKELKEGWREEGAMEQGGGNEGRTEAE